jgi:cobalt-zinc-cadmium efflux system outer membrane protein
LAFGEIWCFLLLSGCTSPLHWRDDGQVVGDLQSRTLCADIVRSEPGEVALPADVDLDDGLSEDEAISVALANNPSFQAALAQLGMSGGDLVQANLLTNPSLMSTFPVGVKQWEWTLYVPIEVFLLRPHRVAIAEFDYEKVSQQLTQSGLTLVRDIRVAYADLALANEQWELAKEAARIRREISALTDKRLERGDISELESITARVDSLHAQANAAYLEQSIAVARTRVLAIMGILPVTTECACGPLEPLPKMELDEQALLASAITSRPDVQAAEWAVHSAAERITLARWLFWRLDVLADANSRGVKGSEVGPGVRFDLPIFNRNQGGVIRASAELEQALRNRDAVLNTVLQEVRTAMLQLRQSQDNITALQEQVVPALDSALAIAQKGFDDGGVSFLFVLQATSQYLDAKARLLEQLAAARRAYAELERGVGHHLDLDFAVGLEAEEVSAHVGDRS